MTKAEIATKIAKTTGIDKTAVVTVIEQFMTMEKDCYGQVNRALHIENRTAANLYWQEKLKTEAAQRLIAIMTRLNPDFCTDKERDYLERNGWRRNDFYFKNLSTHHIMYKLGNPLFTQDEKRAYEFLIELDVDNPNVGIYYGCKALILDNDNDNDKKNIKELHDEFYNPREKGNDSEGLCPKNVPSIKDQITKYLDATFPYKSYEGKYKYTDNANNHTFWPFWITANVFIKGIEDDDFKNACEDSEDEANLKSYSNDPIETFGEDIIWEIARAVRIIRNVFKTELELKSYEEVSVETRDRFDISDQNRMEVNSIDNDNPKKRLYPQISNKLKSSITGRKKKEDEIYKNSSSRTKVKDIVEKIRFTKDAKQRLLCHIRNDRNDITPEEFEKFLEILEEQKKLSIWDASKEDKGEKTGGILEFAYVLEMDRTEFAFLIKAYFMYKIQNTDNTDDEPKIPWSQLLDVLIMNKFPYGIKNLKELVGKPKNYNKYYNWNDEEIKNCVPEQKELLKCTPYNSAIRRAKRLIEEIMSK